MNRDYGSHRTAAATADQLSGLLFLALLLQIFAEFFRVHVVRAFVNVDKFGKSTGLRNGFGSGNEGVRYGHDYVALLDVARHDRKPQGIGAAADGYRVACATERGECLFELFYHGTANESGGVQNLVKDGCEFLFHLNVGGHEVEKWNVVRVIRIAHFVTSAI